MEQEVWQAPTVSSTLLDWKHDNRDIVSQIGDQKNIKVGNPIRYDPSKPKHESDGLKDNRATWLFSDSRTANEWTND